MSLPKEGKSVNIFKLSNCEILVSQIIWKRTFLANPILIDLQNKENFTGIWALVISLRPVYVILNFCMVERNFKINLIFAYTRLYSFLTF